MVGYMGRLFSAMSSALEFNQATLSGAIDIIVVTDEKGRRHCSPFHVRFGKLQLLKTRGLPVSVELNGKPTKLRLYLGPAGEAYFYRPHATNDSDSTSALVQSAPTAPTAASSAAALVTTDSTTTALEHAATAESSTSCTAAQADQLLIPIISLSSLDNPVASPATPASRTSSHHAISASTATVLIVDPAGGEVATTSDSSTKLGQNDLLIYNTELQPGLVHSASTPIPDAHASDVFANADANLAAHLAEQTMSRSISAMPTSKMYSSDTSCGYVSDSEVEVSRIDRDGYAEVVDQPRSPPVSTIERRIYNLSRTRSLRPDKMEPPPSASPPPPPPSSPIKIDERHTAALPVPVPAVDAKNTEKEGFSATLPTDRLRDPVDERVGYGGSNTVEAPSTSAALRKPQNDVQDPTHTLDLSVSSRPHDTASSELTTEVTASAPLSMQSPTLLEPDISAAAAADYATLEVRSVDGLDEDDLVGRDISADDVESRESLHPSVEYNVSVVQELSQALAEALRTVSWESTDPSAYSGGKSSTDSRKNVITARSPEIDKDHELELDNAIISMSLCASFLDKSMTEEEVAALFEAHRVSSGQFLGNPSLLFDPNLLICVDNRLVEFRVAATFILSALAFGSRMNLEALADEMSTIPTAEGKETDHVNPKDPGTSKQQSDESKVEPPAVKSVRPPSRSFWFPWSRAPAVVGEPLLSAEDRLELASQDALTAEEKKDQVDARNEMAPISEKHVAFRSESADIGFVTDETIEEGKLDSSTGPGSISSDQFPTYGLVSSNARIDDVLSNPEVHAVTSPASVELEIKEIEPEPAVAIDPLFHTDDESLSLFPTSEQLDELDLQPGANSVRFTVESSSAEVSCRIFLWGNDTKIVISDIDGTITRSDVLGHVLPAVGRDWSHVGVAKLYTEIARHGYKFMYLTARPIGQASQTRSFLDSVVQGGVKLPNGPVFLSPNRLVESFTREVIRRKPQEFKIGALREVRCLFPPDYNPFHAGFGNRETDVISYRAVGLIPQRIFVVNPQTELAVMNVRYESASSYDSLRDLVDSVFPNILGHSGREQVRNVTESSTFNDWLFWKPPLPELDFDQLLSKSS